jgi:acetylornithine deacetylase
VLNGHIDVVPPGDDTLWTTDPWSAEVRGGRVLGRGACDMKAGLAAQVAAVEALAAAGVRLRGRVQLQSVVGEEDGGLGTFATLRRGYRGDLAVIAEPSSTQLVTACAGAPDLPAGRARSLGARLDAPRGRRRRREVPARATSACGARGPPQPHRRSADGALRAALPGCRSGSVHAGDWASSVADLLVAEGRLGVAHRQPVGARAGELEAAVAAVCDGAWT